MKDGSGTGGGRIRMKRLILELEKEIARLTAALRRAERKSREGK